MSLGLNADQEKQNKKQRELTKSLKKFHCKNGCGRFYNTKTVFKTGKGFRCICRFCGRIAIEVKTIPKSYKVCMICRIPLGSNSISKLCRKHYLIRRGEKRKNKK